ncbi:hypothetical protein RIF29_22044 [Crotalaria pallida]|uniref:Uncharacterized GPI-anchored protein At5g19230-like domain-containing protein n=1 Tax=Crotalaria pallida TaxID=3830 RepID=A0AAN9IA07_CROPI
MKWKPLSCEKQGILQCGPTRNSNFASFCTPFNHNMASSKLVVYLLVSILAFYLFPSPVFCGVNKKDLLHDINLYRQLLNLPVLTEHHKASCLANKIADDLQHKPCKDAFNYYPVPGIHPKNPNFKGGIEKCKININTTNDGIIMPVCVPKLDSDALFLNYTKSYHFTKYLNSSKYTRAGLGCEDDWMVVILSTNTSSGDFSSATSLLAQAWKGHYCFVLALFFFTILFV